jgi:hypothetical protein
MKIFIPDISKISQYIYPPSNINAVLFAKSVFMPFVWIG